MLPYRKNRFFIALKVSFVRPSLDQNQWRIINNSMALGGKSIIIFIFNQNNRIKF